MHKVILVDLLCSYSHGLHSVIVKDFCWSGTQKYNNSSNRASVCGGREGNWRSTVNRIKNNEVGPHIAVKTQVEGERM